ncbi:MAG: ABC transporter ATP-binding protein [Acidilobaceae archaeon]
MFSPSSFLLDVENVTVIYPGGVVANKNAYLKVKRGEVVALLGENGAGKTTLVKVVAGMVKPVSGKVVIEGYNIKLGSPADSLKAGFFLVTQHPLVFDDLTVAEDVGLAVREAGFNVSLKWVKNKILEVSERYGLGLDPERPVWSLSVGEKHKVELVKALIIGSKAIAFDETTSHLTPLEAERFMKMIRELAEEGRAIVFITHKIKEALRVADKIQVMRKGEVIRVLDKREASVDLLIKMMFGEKPQETTSLCLSDSRRFGSEALLVQDLWVRDDRGHLAVKGVSVSVREGEIVGIAGVAGNGQREFFEALVGLRASERGRILIFGKDVTRLPPEERLKLGVSVIPEERLGWALAEGLPIYLNVALSLLGSSKLGFVVNYAEVKSLSKKVVESMRIEARSIEEPVETLSGGNMQRLIVGRELSLAPKLVIAMNPTTGLDYSSTLQVRKLLINTTARGSALLVISEDLEELLEVSDKIVVMSRGVVTGSFSRPFDLEAIAKAMVA